MMRPLELSQRTLNKFWLRVKKTDSCWLWTGSIDRSGYGRFHPSREESYRAHRASWIIHFGEIPDGLFVCHKCDNKPCVRPDHFFLGTASDNMGDAILKGKRKGVGGRPYKTAGRSSGTYRPGQKKRRP